MPRSAATPGSGARRRSAADTRYASGRRRSQRPARSAFLGPAPGRGPASARTGLRVSRGRRRRSGGHSRPLSQPRSHEVSARSHCRASGEPVPGPHSRRPGPMERPDHRRRARVRRRQGRRHRRAGPATAVRGFAGGARRVDPRGAAGRARRPTVAARRAPRTRRRRSRGTRHGGTGHRADGRRRGRPPRRGRRERCSGLPPIAGPAILGSPSRTGSTAGWPTHARPGRTRRGLDAGHRGCPSIGSATATRRSRRSPPPGSAPPGQRSGASRTPR